jgi:hypothetical protein
VQVADVSCAHGVTVPVQLVVPVDQTHPYWVWQAVLEVSCEHGVKVPVHPVDQLQPAYPQDVVSASALHDEGTPEQYAGEFVLLHVHPMAWHCV